MEKTLIHNFNLNTLIIDKEIKELFDKEINLLLTPMEVEENAVVGAIWDASGGPNMCPLCSHLNGQIFPVESGEFTRLEPPLHQNCYDRDTEVYMKDGWRLFKDVVKNDEILTLNPTTKNLEWGRIKETVAYKEDRILYLRNKQHSFDMAISKTHPFFGYKRIDRGKRGRVPEPIFYDNINQLNSEFMFYTSSKWIGENKKGININGIEFKTEDYCKLMGYYLSEGSTIRRKTGRYQINIAQEKYLLEMWDDLNGLPLKKIWLGKKAIDISDNRLGKYLINFGKSNDRFVPDEIKKLSPKYIRLFLDAFIMGDGFISKNSSWKNGNFNDSRSYFTCSKKLADGLGELIIKTGKTISYTLKLTAGTEHQFKNGKYVINYNVWIINELTSQYKFFKNIEIKEREYNDFVYDVEVDKNHTILIRRNGKVIWGSNCQCILRYVTGRQRGIAERLTEYQPVDKDLLAKWSSKIFTKAEIREMAKQADSVLIDFHKNLSQAEKEALDTYSGRAYKDMRLYMKGGAPERKALLKEWGDEWYDKIKKDSDTILNLFRKYHDGQAKVAIHRSLGDLDETFYNRMKAYKSGDAISIDKSMTSWTTDSKITDDFIGGTHRVKFSLRGGRKTTKELDVWRYSSQAHEKEVLVNTTNFKIVEVKEVIDKEAGTNTLNVILGEI